MAETAAQRRRRLTASVGIPGVSANQGGTNLPWSPGYQAPAPAPAPSAPTPYSPPSYNAPAQQAAPQAPAAPAEPVYNRNAYEALTRIYESYGLGELAPVLLGFAIKGIEDPDTVEILIREEPAFKKRFAANEIRKQKGMNVLSVNDYLRLEDSYSSIMRGSGLPEGFYDSRDDFTNWIANDVSAQEINDRVQWAQQMSKGADPNVKRALMEYENLGEGDITAYFLDQKRASTLFETRKAFGSAQIGGAAKRQGLNIAEDRAKAFYDQGVTGDQANQAFGAVASVLPTSRKLGGIYGEDYTQTDAEDEFLGGTASSRRKRERLAEKETASFSGNGGASRGSLGRRARGRY